MPSSLLFSSCLARFAALSVCCALATGCLTPTSPSQASPDGLTCGRRLVGGMWKFTGFTPDNPLDPQTRAAIEQLHGTLRLGFDGTRALTTGPGLYHLGEYRITREDALTCTISAPDDRGVVTDSAVRFLDGNHIEVIDSRSAVPGRATMERVPNGS